MSRNNSRCWMFAGPTLNGCSPIEIPAGIKILPPVRRGDIERIISRRTPATIAIVDGQFHQCLSVGHAEIRAAIAHGWQVWGLCSMGAIRACEMRHIGMKGYGHVYEWFCRDPEFRDDEVALMHDPISPYTSFSEPLIHIRLWLQELVNARVLTVSKQERLLRQLTSIWFGDRTLSRVREMVLRSRPANSGKVEETLANFQRFRLKSNDLSAFIQDQPWKQTGLNARPSH